RASVQLPGFEPSLAVVIEELVSTGRRRDRRQCERVRARTLGRVAVGNRTGGRRRAKQLLAAALVGGAGGATRRIGQLRDPPLRVVCEHYLAAVAVSQAGELRPRVGGGDPVLVGILDVVQRAICAKGRLRAVDLPKQIAARGLRERSGIAGK